MNTILVVFVAALCLNGAFASPVAKPNYEDTQERTLINANGGMYLGLNTSTLVIGLVVIAALAVGVIALSGSGLLDEVSGQQRYDQEQYYQQEGHPYRTKRSYNENMVTKMLQLEQIFKKYEVEEDECRAYIACEAANVERLAENGPIVQKAHELFSSITKPEHLIKLKGHNGMMIMKQAYDSAKTRQHEADVCAPLRDACSALRQKAD
jgi:hypothetical protein